MLLIGFSTFCVGLLPTYAAVGVLAPILLVVLRLIQGFAVGGEISGASAMILEHSPFGRRGYYTSFTLQGVQAGQIFAAAIFLPLSAFLSKDAFQTWGWRIPFLLSAVVVLAGYHHPPQGARDPGVRGGGRARRGAAGPDRLGVQGERHRTWFRVFCMALMNAIPTAVTSFGATFATNAAYGVGLTATNYLWISVSGNIIAVVLIPFVGNLSDKIGRRPVMIIGCLGSGILAYPYLYFVSEANLRHVVLLRDADVGRGLPGLQRGVPVLLPGAVPDQDPGDRVRDLAELRHDGHLLPAGHLRRCWPVPTPTDPASSTRSSSRMRSPVRARPAVRLADSHRDGRRLDGRQHHARHLAVIAAIACFSARETFRVHMNDLGRKGAVPVPKEEYDRIRKTGVDQPVG